MKKIWGIVSLLILLVVFASSYYLPTAESYYASGVNKIKEKNYMEAIGEFTKAISLKSDFGDAYYQRARAKELLAQQYGFENNELCFDLTQAQQHGNKLALTKLKTKCMQVCHTHTNPIFKSEPSIVLCADFSFKNLSNLPSGTEKLSNCVKLNFMGNKAVSITSNIGRLNNLIVLDISSNRLTTVTPAIGKLTNLEEISINKNGLSSLPTEFGSLINLKKLYIRNNNLTKLPSSIAKLKNLEELDLSLNQLKDLPLHITHLKKLKKLRLVGNQIKKRERENIQALLPNTTIYFE